MTPEARIRSDDDTDRAPVVEFEGSRALVVRPLNFAKGEVSAPHRHRYGQLIYAISGMLVVRAPAGSWIVPSQRGVWVPPLVEHAVEMLADTRMRSAYLDPELSGRIAGRCRVINVSNLLRDLILYAIDREAGLAQDLDAAVGLVVAQMIGDAAAFPLAVPIPDDPRLQAIYRGLADDPSEQRTFAAWARITGATERTLVRRLKSETGMTFRVWRQQIRLLASLERLARGEPVTTVALDVGYGTPSGFITAFRQSLGTTPASYFGPAQARARSRSIGRGGRLGHGTSSAPSSGGSQGSG